MDFYGFYTGRIFDAHEYLGAHPGPGGTTFRVFAPSARAVELLAQARAALAGKVLPGDVVSASYEVFVAHTMLGTPAAERYARQLLQDARNPRYARAEADSLRLVWAHTIPFYQPPVQRALDFAPGAHLAACEMSADTQGLVMDPDHPYESMARRLVYNSFNGGAGHRIDRLLELCRQQQADGLVYFCHWGCKGTQGAAQLVRSRLEEAGYPVLLLDGDGCDRANASDGQTATRLEAFLEMLAAARRERADHAGKEAGA